jgi:hypothetical protein
VLRTAEKYSVQESNVTVIDQFLSERCYDAPGYSVSFSKLYEEFIKSLDSAVAVTWNKQRFSRELPPRYPKAKLRNDGNATHIGNISLEPPTEIRPALVYRNKYLVYEGTAHEGLSN